MGSVNRGSKTFKSSKSHKGARESRVAKDLKGIKEQKKLEAIRERGGYPQYVP